MSSMSLARASALLFCFHAIPTPAFAQTPSPRAPENAPVTLNDIDVVADSEYIRGTDAAIYVATSGATDLTTSHALANALVTLSLADSQGRNPRELTRTRTNDQGQAVLRFHVPADISTGSYRLTVSTSSMYGTTKHVRTVTLSDATKLHVRTDRGMYRPGQTLRWRVTAVNSANAHPIAGAKVQISILDPRGTAIWRGDDKTPATGMLGGGVPLSDALILGRYTVVARVGTLKASTSVKVRAYSLPAFAVTVETTTRGPHAPGDTVSGHVVARYLHGEPVSGRVRLHGNGMQTKTASGTLDKHGRMPFTIVVADDARTADITARVTDGAMRTQQGAIELPLAARQLALAVIPERRSFAAGVEYALTIITTDGHGQFVPATVMVKRNGQNQLVSSSGALRMPITPRANERGKSMKVLVHAKSGALSAHRTLNIPVTANADRVIRLDQTIVDGGAAIPVSGTWKRAKGTVTATLLRHGTPVASTVATVDGKGALRAYVQPPPGVFGLATVRVTDASWDDKHGRVSVVSDQASVYLRPTRLDVSIAGATRYRPGQTANLDVAVIDRAGRPVAGAGLAASVVDERALMLAEPGPDLTTALRQLDVGRAKAAGLVFTRLMTASKTPINRHAMRAIIESLPAADIAPTVHFSAAKRLRQEIERIATVRERVFDTLVTDRNPIGTRTDDTWVFAHSLDRVLARAGWSRAKRQTPWKNTLDWTYAQRLDSTITFETMSVEIARERLERLAKRLQQHRSTLMRGTSLQRMLAQGRVARYMAIDPWGTAIRITREGDAAHNRADATADDSIPSAPRRVGRANYFTARSAGPDLTFGTKDDLVRADLLDEHMGSSGMGYGSGSGSLHGRAGRAPRMRIGKARPKNDEVAVRRNFDQTVLWQVGIRTDANGRHTLAVPLADSITGWRVDVQALGPRGAIGRARTTLQTALPVYLDTQMPHTLTVGDRYSLPVVVANHTATEKTLTVHAGVTGSLVPANTAHGTPTPRRVTLPPGTTNMVPIDIRARAIGKGVIDLTLRGPDGAAVDATQHTLQVQAPGRLVRSIQVAKSERDALHVSFTVPRDHTPGTANGTLHLFRGVTDQALDGLEGLLREPHGCFEQTSSTTYPNLLVLRLLGKDKKHAATRKRAVELVGKGYQRLISYEVAGGGFSWFGEAPANQVLTAYGLMEFVDMAAVFPVDNALITRTRDWLLGKQNKDGSWTKDASWLHDWSAVQGAVSTTAYIAWALAESGYRGKQLDKAFSFLRKHRSALKDDSYLLALWAAGESARGKRTNPALGLLRKNVRHGATGTYLSAGDDTLFYARGKGADVQVTALGVTALGRSSRRNIASTLDWLWRARNPKSGWGTTQGTVLALRAYAQVGQKKQASGRLNVRLNGTALGVLDLDAPQLPSLTVPQGLSAGSHRIEVLPADESVDMNGVRADFRAQWRAGPARQPIDSGLRVRLTASATPIRVGEQRDMTVRLENPDTKVIAMPTVVIPVPPGFRADPRSLTALQRIDAVQRAEDQGSEIHVYLSRLDGKTALDLPYRLEATAACEVTQRSVQAYAYYNPETRGSSAEHRLTADPRAPAAR